MPRPSRPFLIASRSERLQCDKHSLRRALKWLDSHSQWPLPVGELSIVLLGDTELAALHGQFLDDASPTDVITFPGDPSQDFAGEICVSWERAQTEAAARNLPLSRELTLYIVHGWLHLAGLDDHTDADCRAMRAAEKTLLDGLASAGVLPVFKTTPA